MRELEPSDERPDRSEPVSRSVPGSGVGRGDTAELPREHLRLIAAVDDTVDVGFVFPVLNGRIHDHHVKVIHLVVVVRLRIDRFLGDTVFPGTSR